jgi:hypothetical protein
MLSYLCDGCGEYGVFLLVGETRRLVALLGLPLAALGGGLERSGGGLQTQPQQPHHTRVRGPIRCRVTLSDGKLLLVTSYRSIPSHGEALTGVVAAEALPSSLIRLFSLLVLLLDLTATGEVARALGVSTCTTNEKTPYEHMRTRAISCGSVAEATCQAVEGASRHRQEGTALDTWLVEAVVCFSSLVVVMLEGRVLEAGDTDSA